MKKEFLSVLVLLSISINLSASLGGFIEDIVDAPGDVLYGRGDHYDNEYYRNNYDGWRGQDYDHMDRRDGLLGRRYYRD